MTQLGDVNRTLPRNVNITAAVNGYAVQVGCKTFVFERLESMLSQLGEYLADPEGVEKAWGYQDTPDQAFPGIVQTMPASAGGGGR